MNAQFPLEDWRHWFLLHHDDMPRRSSGKATSDQSSQSSLTKVRHVSTLLTYKISSGYFTPSAPSESPALSPLDLLPRSDHPFDKIAQTPLSTTASTTQRVISSGSDTTIDPKPLLAISQVTGKRRKRELIRTCKRPSSPLRVRLQQSQAVLPVETTSSCRRSRRHFPETSILYYASVTLPFQDTMTCR